MRKSLVTLAVAAVVVAAPINAKAVTANSFAAKCAEAAGTSKSSVLGGINPSRSLTRQEAAVIAANAYYAKDGKTLAKVKKTEKYKAVKEFHRVKDVKSVKPEYRDAVRVVYATGIDTGFRGAKYSTTRVFKPTKKLTSSKANTIVKRIASKSQRQVLTPDAQVCREAKTWNEKHEWKYVLETFPSSYYDKCTDYELNVAWLRKKEKSGVDYASPKNVRTKGVLRSWNGGFTADDAPKAFDAGTALARSQDEWLDLVRTNVETRLNYNYKTIGNGEWYNTLYGTYTHWGDSNDQKLSKNIKTGIEGLKKYKMVCKSGKVVIDPWSVYTYNGKLYVRVYAKFKYVSGKLNLNEDNDAIFSADHDGNDSLSMKNALTVKKYGQWQEVVFDVEAGGLKGTLTRFGIRRDYMYAVGHANTIGSKGQIVYAK